MVGDRIRFAREKRGMTQSELARAAGLGPNSISQYESHKVEPGLYALTQIIAALNVSADWMVGRKTPMDWKEKRR